MNMDDAVGIVVGVLQLALVVGVILFVRRARRPTVWTEVPAPGVLARDLDGALAVPVRKLENTGLLSRSRNSMSPKLWITGTGLRVKVFRATDRPFGDFKQVEARKAPFGGGVMVAFLGHGVNEAVIATVGDAATARAVLLALPRSLPLTPAATVLRDGVSA